MQQIIDPALKYYSLFVIYGDTRGAYPISETYLIWVQ